MIKEFTIIDGQKFVSLARRSIEYFTDFNAMLLELSPDKRYEGKRGMFVTLHSFPSMALRGCIGLPYPTTMLWQAIIEAATSAAFSDPRFPPLEKNELGRIIVEISVLTEPMEISWKKSADELLEKITIGKDGLIAKQNYRSGLLLPQVAPEYKWKPKEFLEQACCKAGLEKNAWKDRETTIQKFQAQIFKEKTPNSKEITEE